MATHPLRSAVFENLVVLEFLKNRLNQGKLPNLLYYRDKSQNEVDILQEQGNQIHAFEVKSAKNFHKDFLSNLNYLKKILGEDLLSTQLIYDGETEIQSKENGMMNFRNIKFE